MSTLDFLDEISQQVELHVMDNCRKATAEQLGLDSRCRGLYVTAAQDAIVVAAGNDRSLQYYGGFEYVDKECRIEQGGYVFYINEARRVSECLEQLDWAELGVDC